MFYCMLNLSRSDATADTSRDYALTTAFNFAEILPGPSRIKISVQDVSTSETSCDLSSGESTGQDVPCGRRRSAPTELRSVQTSMQCPENVTSPHKSIFLKKKKSEVLINTSRCEKYQFVSGYHVRI